MITRREVLASIIPVGAGAFLFSGCNTKRRTQTVEVIKEVPAPVVESPPYDVWTDAKAGRIFNPQSPSESFAPIGYWRNLTPRIRLWVPRWLDTNGTLLDAAINEVMTTVPEPDTRIPLDWVGVDPDPSNYLPVVVVIMDPGSYTVANDLNGLTTSLALGHYTNYSKVLRDGIVDEWDVLYVAWRPYPTYPGKLLPALNHEIRHRLTRDPVAGHPGGCCSRGITEP